MSYGCPGYVSTRCIDGINHYFFLMMMYMCVILDMYHIYIHVLLLYFYIGVHCICCALLWRLSVRCVQVRILKSERKYLKFLSSKCILKYVTGSLFDWAYTPRHWLENIWNSS